MTDFEDEPGCQPKRPKGSIYFAWATFCASPFLLVAIFALPALIMGKPLPRDLVFASALLIPVFLGAAIGALIFIPLAWINGHKFFKPVLALYSIAILIYIVVVTSAGTW